MYPAHLYKYIHIYISFSVVGYVQFKNAMHLLHAIKRHWVFEHYPKNYSFKTKEQVCVCVCVCNGRALNCVAAKAMVSRPSHTLQSI